MADTLAANVQNPEYNENVSPKECTTSVQDAYGSDEAADVERKYATAQLQHIASDLQLREHNTLISNGIQYSLAYAFNVQKAINYAPPRNPKDDREVSMGMTHEKIMVFMALFLKYSFRRRINVYDQTGKVKQNMGNVYNLAIEYSQRAEGFIKLLWQIYWEVFTQGNAFVFEDWEVRNITEVVATKDGTTPISDDDVDYTFEFMQDTKFIPGKVIQERKARSRVLDGRSVIWGNPEIEEVQDQPRFTIEDVIGRDDAEQQYGSLKMWTSVPADRKELDGLVGSDITLFDAKRFKNADTMVIRHRTFDRVNNRMNLYLNGLKMLPSTTPLTFFYPRGNYPISNVPCERLKGSIYARSIPAKTKFNADYIDFMLKMLTQKFEQGVVPALLGKGKYTLSRDIFRAGNVTHGITPEDYTKADPLNTGVTTQEFSFFNLIKEIITDQTFNVTSLDNVSAEASATAWTLADQNQRDQLANMLDGISNGFMDITARRAETIESKYTIKQKETYVDGKKVNVYQNFTINMDGVDNEVVFDDTLGDPTYDHTQMRSNLHQQSHQARKNGKVAKFYIVNPTDLRKGDDVLDIQIVPQRIKETDLQVQALMTELDALIATFGANVNIDEAKTLYVQVSGRSPSIFNSQQVMQLQQIEQAGNQQTFGAPQNPVALQANGGTPAQPAPQPAGKPAARPSMLAK
jgi:hypothetical protein